jgi:hypothetical protein
MNMRKEFEKRDRKRLGNSARLNWMNYEQAYRDDCDQYAWLGYQLAMKQMSKQEPVAWRWFAYKQWHITADKETVDDIAEDGTEVFPLYVSPVQQSPDADRIKSLEYLLHCIHQAVDTPELTKQIIEKCLGGAVQQSPRSKAVRDDSTRCFDR